MDLYIEVKMKKFRLFLLGVIGTLLFTGCDFIKIDNMEDIDMSAQNPVMQNAVKQQERHYFNQ